MLQTTNHIKTPLLAKLSDISFRDLTEGDVLVYGGGGVWGNSTALDIGVTQVFAGTGIAVTGTTSHPIVGIDTTSVTAATYTNPSSLTVNAQGQLTAITSGSAPVTSVTGTSGEITVAGTSTAPILSLGNTTVTGASYTYTSLSVDSKGRLTAASNGVTPVQTLTGTGTGVTVGGTATAKTVGLTDINGGTSTNYSTPITLDNYGRGTFSTTTTSAALDLQVAGTQSISSSGAFSTPTSWVASVGTGITQLNSPTVNAWNGGTGVFTFNKTGCYSITGAMGFATNATGARGSQFLIGGAGHCITSFDNAGASNQTDIPMAFIAHISTIGTTLQLQCFQNSGGNLTGTYELGVAFLHE
jgi:hypothetical protein